MFTRLFDEWGVILLDASDVELEPPWLKPIYRGAIERAAELDEALLARGRELEAAGYHQQVKVTPSSTLLFTLKNGSRVPVNRDPDASATTFLVGDEKITPATVLLRRISSEPHQFSANVPSRPVVQDHLLPTFALSQGDCR